MLDAPIDESEVRAAILTMKSGRSPGLDGFPAEYYKVTIDLLAPILTKVYTEALEVGLLPPTFNDAVITILLKKEKDPYEPSSYRPISLENVDCKILSKVLAMRLEKVLPKVINEDQATARLCVLHEVQARGYGGDSDGPQRQMDFTHRLLPGENTEDLLHTLRVVEILQLTMDIILEKKIILTEILSAETAFILQHVQQNKLITDRDYSALKSLPPNTEMMSGEVLDKLRDKGEDTCPGVSAPATPPQDPDHISKINEYKTSICSTYKKVKEYNSLSGESVLLADRYTELLIVETHRKQREREEEIRFRGEHHQQVLKTRASEAYNRITVDQLFKPDDRGDVPKAVILQGHSGHGKSFTVQKIMYDWASGKVFKDLFHLVLHLKCKEFNEISEECSLVDLLSYCPSFTSETAEVLKDSKMKVLFLIDGFDELKFSFEETSTVPHKDPFREATVEATLGALLKGLVLPKCFLLVTTRSTASDKLSKLLSDSQRFTDILGFTEEGVNEYFQRFFKEELLAKKAFDCVRTNETLYTACFIPVICWITCTVFREQEEEGMDITKELETTTSIFVHFVSILLEHHCQGLSQPETLLRSLGQLAERGLQEHQVLFDEKSLSEAFPDPSQEKKYNLFLCKFLLKKKVKQERMYSFMHLSFQEFFAALQYLMLENEEEALDKLQALLGNFECFQPVVQFLFGLSNRGIDTHLIKQSRPSIKARLQKWLLRVLKRYRTNPWNHKEIMLHILHCLYELHEEEFVREAMGVWGEVMFDRIPLTRTDCWVLLYCLQCCPTIGSLKLTKCNITAEKLRMLQPALSRCEELG
ncbi:NACHT, LRR and PYD domains-containing protein 1 homolog [Clupea harengus]|uniref:NACHT, LRR and PYD domains-containing protein 1 homolog n=1 Tax=Clupea harengus TaxID=7950 RepID=A0A6P8F1H9_CLUHA|nr:NACHT, LRR and PYD domains-containing protein 1 homolog [Clupea harengus]